MARGACHVFYFSVGHSPIAKKDLCHTWVTTHDRF